MQILLFYFCGFWWFVFYLNIRKKLYYKATLTKHFDVSAIHPIRLKIRLLWNHAKILLQFFLCVQRKYNSTRNGENNLNLRMLFAKQFYLNYMYTQTQIIFSNMWYTISTFKKTRKHSGLLQLRLKSVEGIRPFFIV